MTNTQAPTTTAHFALLVQGEDDIAYNAHHVTDSAAATLANLDDVTLYYGVDKIHAADIGAASAGLDFDGRVIEAAWYRAPGEATYRGRTLIALVELFD